MNQNEFVQALTTYFSISELNLLCAGLSVSPERIAGANPTRDELAYALVKYCERHDAMPDLVALCQQQRPQVAWQYTPGSSPKTDSAFTQTKAQQTNKLPYIVGGLSLLVILLLLYFFWQSRGDVNIDGDVSGGNIISNVDGDVNISTAPTDPAFEKELDTVAVDGRSENTLIAYNSSGFPIWRKQLESRITNAVTADLDDDGTIEVIVGLAEPGERPGWLLIFDPTGNLLTEYDTWQQPIYQGGAKESANIAAFEITDLTGDGKLEILLLANDTYWYPSQLIVLNYIDGTIQQTAGYWHPGLQRALLITDLNADGIQDLIIQGTNNDLQQVIPEIEGNVEAVYVLDGRRINGQAPPSFGRDEPGTELWYGFVTPPQVSIAEIDIEDIDKDGQNDIHVALSDSCSFYLTRNGYILGGGRGTQCRDTSRLLVLEPSLPVPE